MAKKKEDRLTSDHIMTFPSGGIIISREDLEKIKDTISCMDPGYPTWNNEESLVENIVRCVAYNDDYISDNYTSYDPYSYDYSISDSYCEVCDG